VAILVEPVETGAPADGDDRPRLGEAELNHRQQRVASGECAGVVVGREQPSRLLDARRPAVVELGWTLCGNCTSYQSPSACIARQTRAGVSGMSTCRMPSVASPSITAFTTAGVDAIVPVSPAPFTPSGLTSVGVSVRSSSIRGMTSAFGTGYSIMLDVRSCPF